MTMSQDQLKIKSSFFSTPGTQFNETTDKYYLDMFQISRDCISMEYQEFQNKIELSGKDKNYVRNLVPFYESALLMKKKLEGRRVISKDSFTDFGKMYYHCIHSLEILNTIEKQPKELRENFERLRQHLIQKAIFNIIHNSYSKNDQKVGYSAIFRKILIHLQKWEVIDKDSFALVLYSLQDKVGGEEMYNDVMGKKRLMPSWVWLENDGEKTNIPCFPYFITNLNAAGIVSKKEPYKICCDKEIITDIIGESK